MPTSPSVTTNAAAVSIPTVSVDLPSGHTDLHAPSEAINLDFDSAGHLYATHALHAFAARCPPQLVRWAIERYSAPGDVVLDPMCGSGTTLVEAGLCGRVPWGADIDPLARLLALAKATLVDPALILAAAADLAVRLGTPDLDPSWRPQLTGLTYWFREDVANDLARLRLAIRQADVGEELRRLLWAVYSSLIVARTSVANARDLAHSRHHYRAWETAPDVGDRFLKQLRRAARQMTEFRVRLQESGHPTPQPRLVGADARALDIAPDGVDLIFTSPPYCTALDYTRAHSFSVAWLADVLAMSSDDYRTLARRYIGSERAPLAEANAAQPLPPASGHALVDTAVTALREHPKRAWIVSRYFRDMVTVLQECGRVLRPGGHAVLVVCPSNIRKVRIPTHEVFAELAPAVTGGGLHLAALHERTIHDRRRLMPYLEASFGERMRTEYVLVLRKGAQN
jgi:DNA modification methylase